MLTAVDADQSGAFANLVFGVVAEEDIEVGCVMGLRGIFHCETIATLSEHIILHGYSACKYSPTPIEFLSAAIGS